MPFSLLYSIPSVYKNINSSAFCSVYHSHPHLILYRILFIIKWFSFLNLIFLAQWVLFQCAFRIISTCSLVICKLKWAVSLYSCQPISWRNRYEERNLFRLGISYYDWGGEGRERTKAPRRKVLRHLLQNLYILLLDITPALVLCDLLFYLYVNGNYNKLTEIVAVFFHS